MSAFNPRQNSNNHQDPFDRWQYRLFKFVLFLIGVWGLWKFLNEHVPIGAAISRLLGH